MGTTGSTRVVGVAADQVDAPGRADDERVAHGSPATATLRSAAAAASGSTGLT